MLKYMVTYIKVGKWKEGGTQKKKQIFDTKEELLQCVRSLHSNIRVGAIKMYTIKNQ